MKLGIVIPTYNRSKLLKRAIDSVLNQSFQNFIVCIVEDCSPDDTKTMMENYKDNEKVKYIRLEKNSGVNVARNKAIDYLTSKEVDCDYITMLDDDDYFTLDTFQEANKYLNNQDIKWLIFNRVYPNGEKITKTTKYGKVSYLEDQYCGTTMSGDAVMFISKDLIKNKRFEESFRAREYLFFLLLDNESDMYVVDYDAVICEYLPDGMTHSQKKESKEEKQRVRSIEQNILKNIGLSFELLEYKRNKNLFLDTIQKKQYSKTIKYIRHMIKWKLKLFLKG